MFNSHRDVRVSTFVVVVTVLLFACAVWTRAQDPLPTQPPAPAISCPDTVKAGEGLYGTATDPDQPVVVTARSLTRILGTDTTQDGDVNSFCFPTSVMSAGTYIVVSAVDGNGEISIKFVKVIP